MLSIGLFMINLMNIQNSEADSLLAAAQVQAADMKGL